MVFLRYDIPKLDPSTKSNGKDVVLTPTDQIRGAVFRDMSETVPSIIGTHLSIEWPSS